jgi:hypothetical protein
VIDITKFKIKDDPRYKNHIRNLYAMGVAGILGLVIARFAPNAYIFYFGIMIAILMLPAIFIYTKVIIKKIGDDNNDNKQHG